MGMVLSGAEEQAVRAAARVAASAPLPWPELVRLVTRQMQSIVGPSGDRDDLTQSALEHVVRALERFEGRAEFATFTYRVCARVALNHWRGWRRWLRRFQLGMDTAHDEVADERDLSALTLERERARALHAALERMDPMRRLVVTLAELEEVPGARIAEILECPEATVRSRLRRGRSDLYALLAKDPLFKGEIEGRGR